MCSQPFSHLQVDIQHWMFNVLLCVSQTYVFSFWVHEFYVFLYPIVTDIKVSRENLGWQGHVVNGSCHSWETPRRRFRKQKPLWSTYILLLLKYEYISEYILFYTIYRYYFNELILFLFLSQDDGDTKKRTTFHHRVRRVVGSKMRCVVKGKKVCKKFRNGKIAKTFCTLLRVKRCTALDM